MTFPPPADYQPGLIVRRHLPVFAVGVADRFGFFVERGATEAAMARCELMIFFADQHAVPVRAFMQEAMAFAVGDSHSEHTKPMSPNTTSPAEPHSAYLEYSAA